MNTANTNPSNLPNRTPYNTGKVKIGSAYVTSQRYEADPYMERWQAVMLKDAERKSGVQPTRIERILWVLTVVCFIAALVVVGLDVTLWRP